VDKDEVDPIYFESSYYIGPEGAAAKPYALFLAALTDTKQDAIAKIAMHNREHVVLIRPSDGGLILHTLYYPNELHKAHRGETPKTKYSAKELELARNLVTQLKGAFKPQELKDTYRENVERLIAQKQKGEKLTAIKQPAKAPVIDLMEALKRSLRASGDAKAGSKEVPTKSLPKNAARQKAA